MANERERAEGFAAELARAYGTDLVGMVLYGSAARGDYAEGVSDVNLLVLLRRVDAAALRKGSPATRAWVAAGNPPPLVLGAEEWRRSADVFPIELADIRDAHVVLRGGDPFAGIEISPAHLRLQCENELKGKHIQLRERYLLSAEAPEEMGAVLKRALSTFLVLFRTVLRLADGASPSDPEAVIRRTGEVAGFDPAPLLEALRARRTGAELHPAPDAPLVVGYLEAVGRTVEWVDRHPAA